MPHLPHAFRIFWLGQAVSLLGTATTSTLLPMLAPFGPLKGRRDLPAPPPRRSRPLERSISA
ncbi:hypothetical protein [Micromonospora sp. NPDC005806]|uniref:hypothetical protein n=1 Tax=Micromonospora sp. NPDC005806 TaxID=3364234 RepID=UPI003676F9D0